MPASTGRRLAALIVLLILPLFLRLSPVDHGAPRNYVPDASIVRSALGMARDKHPVPPVGRYSTYPNLLPYVLLPVFAGHYFAGRATGAWQGSDAYGRHVLEHPDEVHLLARIVVALLAAANVWVIFRAARATGLGRGAWVAAWLVGTSVLHVHFSVQERPWAPTVLFLSLALWPAALYERRGELRHLVLSGVAAGLAFATHQAGLVALGVPGLAWLFGPGGWSGKALGHRVRNGVLCVAAFAVVGVVLGHPYLLVHGRTAATAVAAEGTDGLDVSVGGQGFAYAFRFASLARMAYAFVGHEPVLALLGLLGLGLALRTRGARAGAVFALFWAAVFLTNYNDHVRYLLPLCVLLAIPAGMLAERFAVTPRRTLLLALLLAVPLAQSVRLGVLLTRTDTRAEAEERLFALPWGTVTAIDFYGPHAPLDLRSLELLKELREAEESSLYRRELHRFYRLREGALGEEWGGVRAVRLEDVFGSDTRLFDDAPVTFEVRPGLRSYGETPPALLEKLGVTHLLVVQRLPGQLQRHGLRELFAGKEPVWVVDPSRGELARESLLPTEMEFPLTGLWSVERPGPWMALYEL